MIKQISIKTKFGWISAFEQNNKIYRVKFGKCKNTSISTNLKKFKSSLNNFLPLLIFPILYNKLPNYELLWYF